MQVRLMDNNSETALMCSRLFYEPHIYKAQQDSLREIFGIHIFLNEIENGERLVFGAFSEINNIFLGCVHGKISEDVFEAHLMFKRNVDVLQAVLLAEKELLKFCNEYNIKLKAIIGYIPDFLRASRFLAKRFGCKDLGITLNADFYSYGKKIPCRYFRKEINNV